MLAAVSVLARALAALVVLAASVAHDAPRIHEAADTGASVRAPASVDVDVEQAPRAIIVAPARTLAPRPLELPRPAVRWLPATRELHRARAARARSRRRAMRCRQRRSGRGDPDDF